MPLRPFHRDQAWLLPPTSEDLLPADHPARFVAEFVDGMDRAAWTELGIDLEGEERGAPAYHPRALLSVWVYGFMTRVRSSRKLEAACRDSLPFLWLTGWQYPDHNTLWRFYQAHRQMFRTLFRRTVRTAVTLGLVDFALQAIDGTKVAGNASRSRHLRAAALRALLERVEEAIRDLEAQNETGGDPPPPRLPKELARKEALRERVRAALKEAEATGKAANTTDPDARLMKGRHGMVAGYNAQGMVSPLLGGGTLVTAGDVVTDATDHQQLIPMGEQAAGHLEQAAAVTLADAGYHSGANLAGCEQRGSVVVMPEAQEVALRNRYHKDRFRYDAATDSYHCPHGQRLAFAGEKMTRQTRMRRYRGRPAVCRSCPAFGICTTSRRHGRTLEVSEHEPALRRHRDRMALETTRAIYRRRAGLVEPLFGTIKEELGLRRFLLRGLSNVKAEWALLLTAMNLRSLWRKWKEGKAPLMATAA